MTTTPLWVPLFIAALGVAGSVSGTVAGVLIAQRRSDRRELERWQRERVREHQIWAREDARRTFEQRRDCYIDFQQHLRRVALALHNVGYELGPPLDDDWNLPLYESLLRLRVFATPDAAEAATEVYNATWRWGHAAATVEDDAFHKGQDAVAGAEAEYLRIIRFDLGVDLSATMPPH